MTRVSFKGRHTDRRSHTAQVCAQRSVGARRRPEPDSEAAGSRHRLLLTERVGTDQRWWNKEIITTGRYGLSETEAGQELAPVKWRSSGNQRRRFWILPVFKLGTEKISALRQDRGLQFPFAVLSVCRFHSRRVQKTLADASGRMQNKLGQLVVLFRDWSSFDRTFLCS